MFSLIALGQPAAGQAVLGLVVFFSMSYAVLKPPIYLNLSLTLFPSAPSIRIIPTLESTAAAEDLQTRPDLRRQGPQQKKASIQLRYDGGLRYSLVSLDARPLLRVFGRAYRTVDTLHLNISSPKRSLVVRPKLPL